MMGIPVVLAHGALGIWDEVVFLTIAVIFLAMMAVSWLRSRGAEPPPADEQPADVPVTPPENTSPDHFRLD